MGSVAASLANAKILLDNNSSMKDRMEAEKDLISLIPAVNALGISDILQIKDEKIKRIVDAYQKGY